MKKVLFVDDEVNILKGLKRMLHAMRHEWDMYFVDSGQKALDLLQQDGDFKVIVSDIRMPVMDGVELLTQVKKRHPQLTRIILSGHSDYTAALASTRVAHQYLAKPSDATALKNAVERDLALKKLLHNESLQIIANKKDALPTPPKLYLDMVKEIESPDGDINIVANLISQDVAMTAKVLQMVNSAFFGLPRNILKISEAVTFLGLDVIRALVLMTEVFSSQDKAVECLDLDHLWHHSMQVAEFSKKLARHEKFPRKQQEQAFLAGMLHDIGYLVMTVAIPETLTRVHNNLQPGQASWQGEIDELGCSHAELGGYLLGLWGLPNALVEPVVHHHQPSRHPGEELNVIAIIHIANALVHEMQAKSPDELVDQLDMEFLQRLRVDTKLEEWRALSGE